MGSSGLSAEWNIRFIIAVAAFFLSGTHTLLNKRVKQSFVKKYFIFTFKCTIKSCENCVHSASNPPEPKFCCTQDYDKEVYHQKLRVAQNYFLHGL